MQLFQIRLPNDSIFFEHLKLIMEQLFNSPFHQSVQQINKEVSGWNWKKVLFPDTRYLTDQGDQFFKTVWKVIDESKEYVWVQTYAMDKSIPANTTLMKLIQARKRGVNTVLFVDDLQQWLNKELLKQYLAVGGTFSSMNKLFSLNTLKRIHNKDIFRRHHEKIIVSDNRSILGSSNLESGYASIKFGSRVFRDFNFYSQNINLVQQRAYFARNADLYGVQLSSGKSNVHTLADLQQKYPNTAFIRQGSFKFLRSHQPHVREIQQQVLKNINEAQKSILVIQPYYYPIRSFEQAISKAIERGVSVELITSAKRDQPVYKYIKNYLLLKKLIRQGLTVYESREKVLHAKVYVFDDKIMTIGSFNNDRWSWKISNEANVSIHSEEEVKKVKPYFKSLKERCPKVTQPNIGFIRKLRLLFWQRFLYVSQAIMSKTGSFSFKNFWTQKPMSSETIQPDNVKKLEQPKSPS